MNIAPELKSWLIMKKLSAADIQNIVKMRKSGTKVRIIAEKFGVSKHAIQYYIYPKMRKNKSKYLKKYFAERYRNDSKFRERHKEAVKKYQNRPEIAEKIKKYRKTKKVDNDEKIRKDKKSTP